MTYLLLQTFLLLLAAYFAGAFTACLIRRATMARAVETVPAPVREPSAVAETPAYADLSHHEAFEHLEPRAFERVQPRIDILQRPEPRPAPAIADIARFDRALSGPDPNEGMPRISVVEVRPAVFEFVTGPALPWPPPRPPEPEPEPEPIAAPEPDVHREPVRVEAPPPPPPPAPPAYAGYAAAHAAAAAAAATASRASAASPVAEDTTGDDAELIEDDGVEADVSEGDSPVTEVAAAVIDETDDDDDADDDDHRDDDDRDDDDDHGQHDDDDDEPSDDDDTGARHRSDDDDYDDAEDDDDRYDDDYEDDDRDSSGSDNNDTTNEDNAAPPATLTDEAAAAPAPHISAGDDLQRIRAIDADMEQKLKTNGVMRFIDIAKWTPDEIELIDVSLDLDGRIDREQWVEQAQILAKGGETYYSRNRAAAVRATSVMKPQSGPSSDAAAVSSDAGSASEAAGAAPTLEGGAGSSGKSVAELAAAAAAAIAAASASVTRGIKPIEPISPLSKVNPNIAIPARITDAIKAREQGAAHEPQPQPPPAPVETPDGEGDDLKRIRGVGVLIAKRLNALGITHYEQIANWSNADVDRISKQMEFGNRIEREGWIQQARILASGGQTEFSRRFDRGESD